MAFWDTVMDAPGDATHVKRLIPAVVDETARNDPERICFSMPRSANLEDGFQDISFRTFAHSINKMAHFIQREIGRSSMFETVMYMGYPDVRHYIILVALMKTGHKLLLSSHRNGISTHADLIRRSDCTILFHAAGFPVSGILEKCRMETLCVPELSYLLDDTPCEPYPWTRSFDEAKCHPVMVMHTSGSSGPPKPVIWPHHAFIFSDAHQLIPPLDGRLNIWGSVFGTTRRIFNGVPASHGAGMASGLVMACFSKTIVVLGPPGLPTADVFDQVLEYGDIAATNCLPITLDEIATRPDILAKLDRLKYITYFGSPLTEAAGAAISQHVSLYSTLAGAKFGGVVQYATDREDWQCVCLSPTYNGIEMRGTGNLYELVFVRDSKLECVQTAFKIDPQLKEHSMSDLYSKHPTKPHHWKYEGRKDDMITFRNGWRFNPRKHEHIIASHGAVRHCILVRTGKDRLAAIIELKSEFYTENKEQQEELLASLWPRIADANRSADTTAQLSTEHIIFARRHKSFAIAGKGFVQRRATVKMYAAEIEAIYGSPGRRGGISG
ncbi:hypothetical protein BDV95DRAFT_610493 [Massariosphaeria phaeospora]|uniref:AMP-dependent synthetase/ligase domain-containing protein n=1 Tax=Massariosphaeria phaeospora TaxID=100035 RepID=A0A7C8M3Z9_9PLEO|nr:hypothetical protein BDV95DRAFT_610493 [Massariosphaeria phaeospora]